MLRRDERLTKKSDLSDGHLHYVLGDLNNGNFMFKDGQVYMGGFYIVS